MGILRKLTAQDQKTFPMSWAGSTMSMDYLNFGDALSPVMVALLTGLVPERVPTRSNATRLAAVGTIGHGFAKGETWFWGTGCSGYSNPSAPADERIPFEIPEDSRFVVTATRGPVSEKLLTGDSGHRPGVYGDPVWLLPRFYRPTPPKKWKLGVILHLSELADRSYEAHPRPELVRNIVPDDMADDVHLITTCTPISIKALQDKIDEILSCERIVSTSLHGMVIAESYGIPCLYFSPHGNVPGHNLVPLDPDGKLDLRIVDLYSGLGKSSVDVYEQPRRLPTDWQHVMDTVDAHWKPVTLNEQPLIDALPLPVDPIAAERGKTVWDHPVLAAIQLQHDTAEVRKTGAALAKAQTATPFVRRTPRFNERAKQELLSRLIAQSGSIPLSFVASHAGMPYANLGDALSAVVVSALAGLPVRHANFDTPIERLVGVGTIGHAQKFGKLHYWGTGLDASRNAFDPSRAGFALPPDTEFHIHATRGPRTAQVLKGAGLSVSGAYGDPVALLDRIWPMGDVGRTHDLGVIVHITELTDLHPGAMPKPDFARYQVPAALQGSVKIINTMTDPTPDALRNLVQEIAACRAILSTSLHGLVLAETYGVPCAWFKTTGPGRGAVLDLRDDSIAVDHRMRDYYLGAGSDHLLTFEQARAKPTDWDQALTFVTENWSPLDPDLTPLLDSFPLPLGAQDDEGLWSLTEVAKTHLPV